MDWDLILNQMFLISLVTTGIVLAVPVLIAILGEIITESSGIMNLGLEGVMAMGAVVGFMVAFHYEKMGGTAAAWSPWTGLLMGTLAGMLMGLLMGFLTITSTSRPGYQRYYTGRFWFGRIQLCLSPGIYFPFRTSGRV
jgi:general nucleoside transport system permease protein